MAAEADYTPIEQSGNGVKVAFDFAFKILASTDLVVRKKAADGTYSDPLTLGVDYTVAFDTVAETGTVTFTVAPVTGGASNIQRSSDETQGTVYPREGNLPAKTTETALDKLTLIAQELNYLVTKRAPLYAAVPLNPAPIIIETPEDTKGLKWQDNGDGTFSIISTTLDPDVSQAAAAASAVAAAASAVAAAASATAAAASAALAALANVNALSGLVSARPAAPTVFTFYTSTDSGQVEMYSPALGSWTLVG